MGEPTESDHIIIMGLLVTLNTNAKALVALTESMQKGGKWDTEGMKQLLSTNVAIKEALTSVLKY